ncbi:hypothetical protein IHE45_05G160400 [Dioscorea alata]|uniref:Uncharacterized protein n=1 Tax=Dioscorea alata TaxID=55571 RepID=A0ACB7W5U2_DIOAL|nr:hypothetical protein IHE45_05G160400 [Dioscorea alata]
MASHLHFLFILLITFISIKPSSTTTITRNESMRLISTRMKPLETTELRGMVVMNETHRRMLGSFQICSLCTCCGGPKGLCITSPCCYAINCHIPNRPFGYCAFTPKFCNCIACHL